MFSKFSYATVPLDKISLDEKNPRLVTQQKLTSQTAILRYLFDNDNLAGFIKKIASEGKNLGAERPYVVKNGDNFTVVEGNTRIAAYKVLTGLLKAPDEYAEEVPAITAAQKKSLLNVDCTIAPSRDALLAIMANAHFGVGDKSKWGYLGSRKAVYDEWQAGKKISQLAKLFARTEGQIGELIIEYRLYLKALNYKWSAEDKKALLNPAVEFNPPVRFLQSKGHKEKIGLSYDKQKLDVLFSDAAAEKRFRHLVSTLVIHPKQGVGATATFDQVFENFSDGSAGSSAGGSSGNKSSGSNGTGTTSSGGSTSGASASGGGGGANSSEAYKPKVGVLFTYTVSIPNALLAQLMKEAKALNCKSYPAAGTFLLRNLVEALLKDIIDQQKANAAGDKVDLQKAIDICLSNSVQLPVAEKAILKEFKKSHLDYLNLGAHGNVIPNTDRLFSARDCIDQFIKKNI